MRKTALLACTALIAFAATAVGPALASASPVLNNDAATPAAVAVGSHITGFSTNLTVKNGTKQVACSESHIVGTLTKNTGSLIEGNIEREVTETTTQFTGPSGVSTCATGGLGDGVSATIIPENLPWCLRTIGTDEWALLGGECSEAVRPVAFEAQLTTGGPTMTAVGHCTYEVAQVKGTYTTNQTPQKLHITPTTLARAGGGSIICPATMTLEGDFTLSQETAVMTITPVMIS